MRKQWYRFLHNCIAHPLLFFTNDNKYIVRFHDWTGSKMPYYEKLPLKEIVRNRATIDGIHTFTTESEREERREKIKNLKL